MEEEPDQIHPDRRSPEMEEASAVHAPRSVGVDVLNLTADFPIPDDESLAGGREGGESGVRISSNPWSAERVYFGRGPDYTRDMEFNGRVKGGKRRCHCNKLPARRVCSEGPDAGRRFYGCYHDRCTYADWVDGPWPPVLQRCLTRLWFDAQANELAREFAAERAAMRRHEMVDDATQELKDKMRERETLHFRALRALHLRHALVIRALKAKHAAAMRASSNRGMDIQSTTPMPSSGSFASGPKMLPAPHAPKRNQELLIKEQRKKQKCSGKQTEPSGKEVGPNVVGDIRSINTRTQVVASTLEKKHSAELPSSSQNYAPTSTTNPMFQSELFILEKELVEFGERKNGAKLSQIHMDQHSVVRRHAGVGGGGSSGVRLVGTVEVGTVEVDTDWFWCPVCGHLLNGPPIFQCKMGHLACDRCHAKQCQRCDGGSFDARSKVMEDLISACKFACPHKGCNGVFTYPDLIEHREDCHINPPCYCTEAGCTYAAPVDYLLLHLLHHSWPVECVVYGKYRRIRVSLTEPRRMRRLFVGEDDARLFALVVAEQGADVFVSLVCVRADDSEPRYKAELCATVAPGVKFNKSFMTVASSNRPGEVAVENFLTVPLMRILAGNGGASKEFYVKFRIEKN